jgi:hypothetical protein
MYSRTITIETLNQDIMSIHEHLAKMEALVVNLTLQNTENAIDKKLNDLDERIQQDLNIFAAQYNSNLPFFQKHMDSTTNSLSSLQQQIDQLPKIPSAVQQHTTDVEKQLREFRTLIVSLQQQVNQLQEKPSDPKPSGWKSWVLGSLIVLGIGLAVTGVGAILGVPFLIALGLYGGIAAAAGGILLMGGAGIYAASNLSQTNNSIPTNNSENNSPKIGAIKFPQASSLDYEQKPSSQNTNTNASYSRSFHPTPSSRSNNQEQQGNNLSSEHRSTL